jgi:hypothetical protein
MTVAASDHSVLGASGHSTAVVTLPLPAVPTPDLPCLLAVWQSCKPVGGAVETAACRLHTSNVGGVKRNLSNNQDLLGLLFFAVDRGPRPRPGWVHVRV